MSLWNWIKAGYGLGTGLLLVAAMFFVGVFIGDILLPRDFDDTDATTVRSGMKPMTDALTGCQYLKAGSAITPRMGADGQQICGVTK